MADTGASVVASGFSPVLNRQTTSITGRFKVKRVVSASITTQRSVTSTGQRPTKSFSDNGNFKKSSATEKITKRYGLSETESELECLSLKDYFERSKELIRSDGGPPRWFSPLECRSRLNNSPLLLFLPGLDGVGLGLILQHQRLGEIFDIWCLHIPVMDRTSFTDLVKLVEETVRLENYHTPMRPIYLVGESLGGCLALAVAARNPAIDLILILANPATCFEKSQLQPLLPLLGVIPERFGLSVPHVLTLMAGIPSMMVMATLEKRLPLQQAVGEISRSVTALISNLSVLADALPIETLLWKLKMVKSASTYVNSRLHVVKAQTLILSSAMDQFLPSQEEGERLRHMLPKCEIRKFNKSGHALLLEDGIDLVTIIKGASFYRRARHIDYASDYLPPSPSEFKRIYEPFRWIEVATSPVMLSTLEDGKIVRGLAGIPSEGPVLFVGYHMLLGLELAPLVSRFYAERNILVRGMAHPMVFTKLREGRLPDLSTFDAFRIMGAIPVSATNFYRLFSIKSHVLLYPGGMREALHRKGEEYKLFWPEQSEFIRMAARFGAKIIPFGAVGEDDVGQLVVDYDDQVKIPHLKAFIEEVTNEVVKLRSESQGEVTNQGVHLPIIIPKLPGRFYFLFGKPIHTEERKKELRSRERANEVYLEVKSEVEKYIAYLKEKREDDPFRSIMPRLIYQAIHGFESEIPTFGL